MTARWSQPAAYAGFHRAAWSLRGYLLFGLVFTLARHSNAGQSARLVYSRTTEAVGCSDERGLRQAVARRLGYDPFVASAVNTVVAEMRGDGDGLKARVYVVHDGNMAGGARELSAPTRDCTELMAAVALALSIAIDPDALDRLEQPTPPNSEEFADKSASRGRSDNSEPEAKPPSEPRDVPRAAVANKDTQSGGVEASPSPPHASRSLEVILGPFAFVATGPAPFPSFGFGFTAGVVLDEHWVVAIEPELALKSSASLAGYSSIGVNVSWWGGALHLGYQAMGLYAGALFELERLTAQGYGITDSKTEHPLWVGSGLRIAYGLRLAKHWSLGPRIDGLAGLKRQRMQVFGQDVHETPALLGRFGLALEMRF